MQKIIAVLILVGSLSTIAFAGETNCTDLKLTAADALTQVCATDAALSAEEVRGLNEIVVSLNGTCGPSAGESLQRGILYKNLDLNDSCATNAEALATQ